MSTPARIGATVLLLAVSMVLLMPGAHAPHAVTWEDLIAPLSVGHEVTRGYVLAPPRREGDALVYIAHRAAGPQGAATRVEIRILNRGRWSDVPQTRSFSIGWEAPAAGALVVAPSEDADAVRDAFVHAIEPKDRGFGSVDSIPLAGERDPPAVVRVLERMEQPRGMLAGAAFTVALMLIAEGPFGIVVVGVILFVLGLTLRASSLDVPFAHDQDVQRLFTGGLPLRDLATGAGLRDRHPPLYFFVLHFVERFGQSEAVARAPAVLAGALAAPSVLCAAASLGSRVGPTAVLVGLVLTISPVLIDHSRQVSEIPLYALILIAAAASLVASMRAPRPLRLIMLAASHALALFTYYLAPFIVAAHAAVLAYVRPSRRVLRAFACGLIVGFPAVALGAITFIRDWAARDVARAFPALAWGEHAPLPMMAQMTRIALDAFGTPMLALVVAAIIRGIVRRDRAAIIPALGAAATFAGIAVLAPIARVQDYYVVSVLPLVLLPVAIIPMPPRRSARISSIIAAASIVALWNAPLLASARSLYVPSGDAFMREFATVIAQRPESTVVTVAQYDKTILAYYLARVEGRTIGWQTIDDPRTKRIEPLVPVHSLDTGSERAALQRLDAILADGPALVIERDAVLLPSMVQRLDACTPVLQAPIARLVQCAAVQDR